MRESVQVESQQVPVRVTKQSCSFQDVGIPRRLPKLSNPRPKFPPLPIIDSASPVPFKGFPVQVAALSGWLPFVHSSLRYDLERTLRAHPL